MSRRGCVLICADFLLEKMLRSSMTLAGLLMLFNPQSFIYSLKFHLTLRLSLAFPQGGFHLKIPKFIPSTFTEHQLWE